MNEGLIGGIVGSLATYLLTRGKDIGDKIVERYNRHRKALVKLEQIYCENLDIIYRDVDNIEKLVSTIEEACNLGAVPVFFGKFHIINYDKNVLMDLTTVDFMNDVLALNIDYNKANSDMDTVANIYEKMKVYFAQKIHASIFIDDVNKLNIFLENLDKNTEKMLAKVQAILDKKPPFLVQIIMLFMQKKAYGSGFEKTYQKKLLEVKKGRKEVMEKSRKELATLYKKTGNSNP